MKKYLILLLLLLLLLTGCKKYKDEYYFIKVNDETYSYCSEINVSKNKITFRQYNHYIEIINPENVIIMEYDR